MSNKVFLTAECRNLLMINYGVDPAILRSYLPVRTELDYWDDKCYVSLVGFMFQQVRVRGIKIPFHTNFPEINLRFYVRYKAADGWKRGVVFIKEIVPKRSISFIANSLFNENYRSLPMKHLAETGDLFNVEYRWMKNKKWNGIKASADLKPQSLINGSKEEFITEHFWGYTRINRDRTGEYQVAHPHWDVHSVKKYEVDCDFGQLYGAEFSMLEKQEPASIFLATGSPIKVFTKKEI